MMVPHMLRVRYSRSESFQIHLDFVPQKHLYPDDDTSGKDVVLEHQPHSSEAKP